MEPLAQSNGRSELLIWPLVADISTAMTIRIAIASVMDSFTALSSVGINSSISPNVHFNSEVIACSAPDDPRHQQECIFAASPPRQSTALNSDPAHPEPHKYGPITVSHNGADHRAVSSNHPPKPVSSFIQQPSGFSPLAAGRCLFSPFF